MGALEGFFPGVLFLPPVFFVIVFFERWTFGVRRESCPMVEGVGAKGGLKEEVADGLVLDDLEANEVPVEAAAMRKGDAAVGIETAKDGTGAGAAGMVTNVAGKTGAPVVVLLDV